MTEEQPWERSPLEIEITDGYASQIFGEEGEDYLIEFRDRDMEVVEARIPKTEFENFPHSVRVGTHFGIILYEDNGETAVKVWPTKNYWNPELRG